MSMGTNNNLGLGEGLNAGTVFCRITVDAAGGLASLKQFNAGLKASAAESEQQFGQIKQGMNSIALGLGVVGVASLAAVAHVVKTAGAFEQLNISMTTLLGNKDRATAFLNDLRKFEPHTPYTMESLASMSRMLMAAGLATKDIIPGLKAIGDTASALGATEPQIRSFTQAIQEIKNGAPMSRELMRMSMDFPGFNPYKAIADGMGVSIEKVHEMTKKGALDADAAVKALFTSMEKLYGGAMQQQMESLNGQISNLKTKLWNAEIALGTALLPTIKTFTADIAGLTDKFNGLSPEMQSTIASTMLWGGVIALASAGTIKATLGIAAFVEVIRGAVLANTMHVSAITMNSAAISTYGESVHAVAVAQYEEAQAILADVAAMDQEIVATGQATEADIAFIEAEAQRALALEADAVALGVEATATVEAANANAVFGASFLAAMPTLALYAVAIAGISFAIYEFSHMMDQGSTATDILIEKSKKEGQVLDDEIARLNLAKTRRQSESELLQILSTQYETLTKKQHLSGDEQERLHTIKDRIIKVMGTVRSELGLQAKAWDGTTASIKETINKLLDFSEIERKLFVDTADKKTRDSQTDLLNKRKAREDALKDANAADDWVKFVDKSINDQKQLEKNHPVLGKLNRFETMNQTDLDRARQKAEAAHTKAYDLAQDEAVAYDQYQVNLLNSRSLHSLTPAEIEDMRKKANAGGGGSVTPVNPVAGTTSSSTPDPTVLEQTKRAVAAAYSEKAMLGEKNSDFAQKMKDIYANALTQLASKAAELGFDPTKHPDYKGLQDEFDKWSGNVKGFAEGQEAIAKADAEQKKLVDLRAQHAQLLREQADIGADTPEKQLALAISREDLLKKQVAAYTAFRTVIADNLELQNKQLTAENALTKATQDRKKLEDDISKSKTDAIKNAAIEAEQHRLDDADFRLKTGTASVAEILAEEQTHLATLTKDTQEWRDSVLRVIGYQTTIADEAQREADARIKSAEAANSLFEQANEERLRGMRERGELSPFNEMTLTGMALAKAELQAKILQATGQGEGEEAGRLAVEIERLKNELGKQTAVAFPKPGDAQAQAQAAARFGDALWNYPRDKASIKKYFDQVLNDAGRDAFQKMFLPHTDKDGKLIPGSIFKNIDPKKLPSWVTNGTGQKVLNGAGALYGMYEGATGEGANTASGAMSGVMAGAMVTGPLAPIAMLAGGVIGGILGNNTAEKRAREEAQRQRDAMLAELRKMNNALQPVSDFFRQGVFANLPGWMTFGGAQGSLARSYAIESSRGAR